MMNMTKKQLYTAIAVTAGLALVALFFIFGGSLTAQPTLGGDTTTMMPTNTEATSTGLIVQDEVVGTGAVAQAGDMVTVTYVGKLQDGTIFDQSSAHTGIMPPCTEAGQFCFVLGQGNVIPGWDQGLQGMKVGGKRLLIIPPQLGYGAEANGSIPANSTLIFEVDLLGVAQPATTTGASDSAGPNLEGAAAN
jgi:FKBP-type peptidyl-prolyl cis-trans isomerase FkpA